MTNIYISSTSKDLKEHRSQVCLALRRSGYDVTLMEEYAAKDKRPVKKCLADVRRADIYIGIFGQRYGYIPDEVEDDNPDRRSITELEFRQAAVQPKTACLVFLSDPEVAQIPDSYKDAFSGENDPERIGALRDELGKSKTASFFRNPDHLAHLVQSAISSHLKEAAPRQSPGPDESRPISWSVERWGPPYPGLLHFKPKYAPVFFGREAEIREVIDRLYVPEGHFVIVSGGSGSGKSSLVHAGVLHHLKALGLGDKNLECRRMLPSDGIDCFDALTIALAPQIERAELERFATGRQLAEHPATLAQVLEDIANNGPTDSLLLLFVDQMEELFVAGSDTEKFSKPFLTGLYEASSKGHLRVIATIRSDQLQPLYDHPQMLGVLNSDACFNLGPLPPYALDDIIVKPAQCAGVSVPPGLVRKLAEDVGEEHGSLPLLAFALRRLFEQAENGIMGEAVYDHWGGQKGVGRLEGAIAEHTHAAEAHLAKHLPIDEAALEGRLAEGQGKDEIVLKTRLSELKARLASIFPKLVRVDIEGAPLRLRVNQRRDLSDEQRHIARELSTEKVRLLSAEGEGDESTFSVTHEKLLSAWPTLAEWVDENRANLITLRRAEVDARDWAAHAHDPEYLWSPGRLAELRAIMETMPEKPIGEATRLFATPQETLIERLGDMGLSHKAREKIGEYLTVPGDPRPGVGLDAAGVPDIVWIDVKGGRVVLEGEPAHKKEVTDFRIARYPITNTQFQAFIDDKEGGYGNPSRWRNMPSDANDGPTQPAWTEGNAPRETVSWYEAVAFTRWLSDLLGLEVGLPDEFQWQQAANLGNKDNTYPWGAEWDPRRCNSAESKLNRSTVVGLYPDGTWPDGDGPLDLAGNVWEWCLNKYDEPDAKSVGNSRESRVLRGGSWDGSPARLRAAYRGDFHPGGRVSRIGFRVVCRPLSSSTDH